MAGLDDKVLNSITHMALHAKVRDDDGVDQLHHYVTVTMLAVFGIITSYSQFVAEPINCWNHGDFLFKHYQDHVNGYCWTHSLYHYPNRTDLDMMPYKLNLMGEAEDPSQEENDELLQVTFFRWATSFFIIQALLFKVPNLMWGVFNAGSNINLMVGMLQDAQFANVKDKQEKLQQMALYMEQWLAIRRKPRWFLKATSMSPWVNKHMSCCTRLITNSMGSHLSNMYLLTKAAYLFNNLMQFLILSAFLEVNFWHLGVQMLQTYSDDGRQEANTASFPTVALCHFRTYRNTIESNIKGSSGRWVQCIITINIFLEKMFLVEWFWFLGLLVLTIASFIFWCFKILRKNTTVRFVQRYMALSDEYNGRVVPGSRSLDLFVTEYLRRDGILILRILAVNTSDVIVSQLVGELEKRYLKCKAHHPNTDEDCAEAETLISKKLLTLGPEATDCLHDDSENDTHV